MFHDEMESVRLNAVMSLSKVAKWTNIELEEELLKSLVTILNDKNSAIRENVYELLQ